MSRKYKGDRFLDHTKLTEIENFVSNYQHCLKALLATLPEDYYVKLPVEIVTVGKSEFWPCQDGVVTLIYSSPNDEIELSVMNPLNKTVNEFLRLGKAMALYDIHGTKFKEDVAIQVENAMDAVIYFAKVTVNSPTTEYSPRYQRGIITGWNAQLPKPDEQALSDFKGVFITRNIGGTEASELHPQEGEIVTLKNADKLIQEFEHLIQTADREEDLQQFLTNYPEFIYPDYIECYPKFKLGEEFITDFVFLVQGIGGLEYVFVEIEKASKAIFTKKNQFSALFTQAKDQLLNWDQWITHNQSYISRKLPNLFKPRYHLIMGRSESLTMAQREKLNSEFQLNNWLFSTYNDIAERFKQILSHLI